jgi:UDP-glucose 4-epimerase
MCAQLRFIILDLGDEARVIELFKAFKFDVVIHFAAVAYVAESYKDPLMYYQNVSRCVGCDVDTQHSFRATQIPKSLSPRY